MANRYWVGGTATWDGTAGTKWSLTSGGPGGEAVPTAADDVFFDAASGAVTCTVSGSRVAKTLTFTGFTGTLTGTSTPRLTISGNLTLGAGMTLSTTAGLVFTINATATITSNGKTFPNVAISGAGITATLGDALVTGGTIGGLTVTQGTFDTAGYNLTINGSTGFSSSNTNTRTINLNASTVSCNSDVDFSTSTNLTFNAGTSQLNMNGSSGNLNGGGQTFYNVTWSSTSLPDSSLNSITGANTFNNLTFNSTNSLNATTRFVQFLNNQTVTGTLDCSGDAENRRIFLYSDVLGTSRTLTAATVIADNCDFRDITIAGAASPISPAGAGDCGGNTNITFPAPKTVYRVGSGTEWRGSTSYSDISGGTGNIIYFPLAQDTVIINNDTTLTGTLSLGGGNARYNAGTLDCSNRTNALTIDYSVEYNWYGDHTLSSSITVSGTNRQTFCGRSTTQTLTTAGKTITFPITIDAISGTVDLGDAFTSSNSISFSNGTFNASNYNLTCTTFGSNNSNTRTITMGSGSWTLSGTGTVWGLATTTGLTFNKDTANITLTNTSTTARTFAGGGLTYNKLTIGGATGTSTLTMSGNNTFSELASTKTVAHTIIFSGNQTMATWSITGSTGNVVTLNSDSNATARTLTKTGGGFLSGIDYLSVRSIIGSPVSDTWYIGPNSTISTTTPNPGYGLLTTSRSSNAVIVLTSTTSTTWGVPSDWNSASNSIHLIGGGGGGAGGRASGNNRAGGGGGGGGGYTRLNNQSLTIGANITYQAGAAGAVGTANNNGGAGGTTSWNGGAATAGGGGGGQAATTPSSTGGTAGTGTTYNGGTGGAGSSGSSGTTGRGGGGGAGAGGPNGIGGNGGIGFGSATTNNISGGGGGGNGGGTNGSNGASGVGGAGGNNSGGVGSGAENTGGAVGGGGGGADGAGIAGGPGSSGIEIFGIGSGGGGGGNVGVPTAVNGIYGGGGGGGGVSTGGVTYDGVAGSQGAIIITYVPTSNATGNMFFMFN